TRLSTSTCRSRIVRPSTTSVALLRPPNRVARPPARMAAEYIQLGVAPPEWLLAYLHHERSRDWPSARREPAPGHRRYPAVAADVLRELVERRRTARRDDRARAVVRGLELPAAGGRGLPHHHDARRRVRGGVDGPIDLAGAARGDQGRAAVAPHADALAAGRA